MELAENILRGIIGVVTLLGICWFFSTDRKAINWRLIGGGMILQFTLAILMIKISFVRMIFGWVVDMFRVMINATIDSAVFMFGDLAVAGNPYGFAFYVLPTIIFFSAFSSILYYLGILQKVVYGFAWVMKKTMRLTGAESLAAAANVFIGQTEAPLVVKPYLEKMSRSEILCLMTGGMATIAGGVFGAYLALLGGDSPEEQQKFGLHLLTASIISAPAAIVAAKLLFPETEKSEGDDEINIPRAEAGDNFLDALARGTTDGLKLAVNVGAMLLAFMAIIYFANMVLVYVGDVLTINEIIANSTNGTYSALSLEYLMGFLFAPLAWLIGVPSSDIITIGQLLGEKTIINEFVAYVSLSDYKAAGALDPKSIIIATYALCGFSNFTSIGIQIGGIGAIAPGQRKTLTEFGLKALVGGTVACLMTATIAGMLI